MTRHAKLLSLPLLCYLVVGCAAVDPGVTPDQLHENKDAGFLSWADTGTTGYDTGITGYDTGITGYDIGTTGYDIGTTGYDIGTVEPDATVGSPDAPISDVSATVSMAGGYLKIVVDGAGADGETKVTTSSPGGFDWTAFDRNRWNYASGKWTMTKPLAAYPSGARYEMGFKNPDTGREDWKTIDIPVRDVTADVNVNRGKLELTVYGAGPNGETKVTTSSPGGFDWTPFDDENRWDFTSEADVWKVRARTLTNYPSGARYEMGFKNPDTGREYWVTVDIPARDVTADVSTSGGYLTISVYDAGPQGETKVTASLGGFDWTAFDRNKWTYTPGNDSGGDKWSMKRALTNYPSGYSYAMGFRNRDTGEEDWATVDIPAREVTTYLSYSGGNLTIAVYNVGPQGETKVNGSTGSFDWTAFGGTWTYTAGNDSRGDEWRMSKLLTSYPSGATYEMWFRNFYDEQQQAKVDITIP